MQRGAAVGVDIESTARASRPHGCQQWLDADDVQHTREVVAEYVQRHFGRDFVVSGGTNGNGFVDDYYSPGLLFSSPSLARTRAGATEQRGQIVTEFSDRATHEPLWSNS